MDYLLAFYMDLRGASRVCALCACRKLLSILVQASFLHVPTLFQHRGKLSSLQGKEQLLQVTCILTSSAVCGIMTDRTQWSIRLCARRTTATTRPLVRNRCSITHLSSCM